VMPPPISTVGRGGFCDDMAPPRPARKRETTFPKVYRLTDKVPEKISGKEVF